MSKSATDKPRAGKNSASPTKRGQKRRASPKSPSRGRVRHKPAEAAEPKPATTSKPPTRLAVPRTFVQRSRLLLAGSWLVGCGLVCIALGVVMLLVTPRAVGGNPVLVGVHFMMAAIGIAGGLACIYAGLAPALARNSVDARGIRRRFLFLPRRVAWRDVYLLGLADDIALQAGRAEVSIPCSRGFVQRHEQVLLGWWRRAVSGSGRRCVPLVARGPNRPGLWLSAGGVLAVAAWLCAAAVVDAGAAGVFFACALAAGALASGYIAAALSVERVELSCRQVRHRRLLARDRVELAEAELVVLDRRESDFKTLWGRIELYARGASVSFRCAGEAYETLSATIVRRCPRAFVWERHTDQVAPPLVEQLDSPKESCSERAAAAAIKRRAGAILSIGAAGLCGLVAATCLHLGMWLASAMASACGLFWAARAAAGWARARRAASARRAIDEFETEQLYDPEIAPEDYQILDLIA
jgi:hypothetical protein